MRNGYTMEHISAVTQSVLIHDASFWTFLLFLFSDFTIWMFFDALVFSVDSFILKRTI